ncbi:MAG: hypothetical protein ACE5KJ_06170, partial [Candidatus Zixiibacteriota bacterium]
MRFFNFTPQEIKALLFLLIALLVGSGITIYKRHHPNFAPELIFKEPPPTLSENQFNEAPKEVESYGRDASSKISKSSITSPISAPQTENRVSSMDQSPRKRKIDLN